jgi:hypothetical protein
MPLDRNTLETTLAAALRTNFKKGKDEEWSADQAADALAKAIADTVHTYVGGARVTGVQSQVRDPGNNVIGTGTQTNSVALG